MLAAIRPDPPMEDDNVHDFKLVENKTFLEYLPICRAGRSASCPGRLNRTGSVECLLPASRRSSRSASFAFGLPRPGNEALSASPRNKPNYAKAGSNETLASAADTATTTCSQEDADETTNGREPGWSAGSSLHPQRCKPCAWFWRPAGCARGTNCHHCHTCLPGELVRRRKQNRVVAKTFRSLAKERPQLALPSQLCFPAAVPMMWPVEMCFSAGSGH